MQKKFDESSGFDLPPETSINQYIHFAVRVVMTNPQSTLCPLPHLDMDEDSLADYTAFLSSASFLKRPCLHFRKQPSQDRRFPTIPPTPCMSLNSISRRQSLKLFTVLTILSSFKLLPFPRTLPSSAAMYDTSTKVKSWIDTTNNEATKDLKTYMPQIQAGYKALKDLQQTWEDKTKDFDGDVVRRVLGTVGVKSPLVNIRKSFLGAWKVISDDSSVSDERVGELEELWNDILNSISSIDFQLYSVNFTELNETKENLVKTGKKELDKTVDLYKKFLEKLPTT